MIQTFGRALIAVSMVAGSLGAQIITVPYNTLYTVPTNVTSYLYTGLDGSGTTMSILATNGGIFTNLVGTPGPNSFPGLWFGGNSASGTYRFTFNKPVTFFEMYVTAQSTLGQVSEIFNGYTVNGGTPTFAFTNVSGTAWDGSNLTSTQNDGRSILGISVGAGESFTSITFNHVQVGGAAGSVIERIRYEAKSNNVVPEPSTYALMATGLLVLGFASSRRKARQTA